MNTLKKILYIKVALVIVCLCILLFCVFLVAAAFAELAENEDNTAVGTLDEIQASYLDIEFVTGKFKIYQKEKIRLFVYDQEGNILYKLYGHITDGDVSIYKDSTDTSLSGSYRAGKFEISGQISGKEFYMKGPSSSASGYIGSGAISLGQAESSGKLIFPVANYFYGMTSDYEVRQHPIFGYIHQHAGVDLACKEGADIVAAGSGLVTFAGWNGGYGYMVEITHAKGLKTRYGHNRSLAVSRGMRVKAGEVIASAGSTGNSTGPHCHFEVYYKGKLTDPKKYIKIP